ncbi:TPA: phage tail protein [Yersinia enterocolitica]|jgi:hypothetical protein
MSQNKPFDINSLKSALLKPTNTAVQTELFGASVYIRRITGKELMDYDNAIGEAQDKGDITAISYVSLGLVLKALVNPDGSPIPKKLLPTVDELLTVHANPELMKAINKVKSHSLGTLEEAEKN